MSFSAKKTASIIIALILIISLCSCGKKEQAPDHDIVLNVFASNNSVLAVSSLVDSYKSMSSYAAVRITYDEPDMLAAKIEAGYTCDIFICEDRVCMDWLDASKGTDVNPKANDCIDSETRAEVFSGIPDGQDTELVFSAAMVKSTREEKEVKKFLSFIEGAEADVAYEGSGFERITE